MKMARNDITGRVIKTDPPNKHYLSRWDYIYAKKLPKEWMLDKTGSEELGGWVGDPDTPIKYSIFLEGLADTPT